MYLHLQSYFIARNAPKFVILFAVFLLQGNVYGTTNTWIVDTGDWFEPTNWSLNHIPMLGETAVIPDTADEVTISGSILAEVNAVQLFGGVLTIADTSTLMIDLQDQTLVGLLIDSGRIDNRGTIIIANGAGSNAYGTNIKNIGLLVNRGKLIIKHFLGFNADAINLEFGSTLDNDGSIEIKDIDGIGADGINNQGLFLNDSSVTIDTIGDGIGLFVSDSGQVLNANSFSLNNITTTGVIVHGGLFENKAAGMLSLAAINEQGIVVENAGKLINQSGGLIRLALSPQILHININLGSEFLCLGELDIFKN